MMMQKAKISLVLTGFIAVVFFGGCESSKYDDLKLRNRSQQERIDELESEHNVSMLELSQCQNQLSEGKALCAADNEALTRKVAVLQGDIDKKSALIEKMQAELIRGGVALPPELASELEKFAAQNDMITFDEGSGMVKFKSDLLFNPGSDVVAANAISAITQLCSIVNSKMASSFDVVIAGHTDDVPIGKPETKRLHPSNWHLSAHRAISVERIMEQKGVSPGRLSVRGFGQYRPVEANKPGRKGNPKNRRVEIYLVPAGA